MTIGASTVNCVAALSLRAQLVPPTGMSQTLIAYVPAGTFGTVMGTLKSDELGEKSKLCCAGPGFQITRTSSPSLMGEKPVPKMVIESP